MKTERTIEFCPSETPIGRADHVLYLCKMMEENWTMPDYFIKEG